jgi:hypothetical protein
LIARTKGLVGPLDLVDHERTRAEAEKADGVSERGIERTLIVQAPQRAAAVWIGAPTRFSSTTVSTSWPTWRTARPLKDVRQQ